MDVLKEFELFLREQDHSKLTIVGYLNDLHQFIRWFEQTNGETFTLQGVTPTDVREYRQHMLVVDRRKANTINRRLAALSCIMNWARQNGLVEHDPTENIHSITQNKSGPRYLDKKEQVCPAGCHREGSTALPPALSQALADPPPGRLAGDILTAYRFAAELSLDSAVG